MRRQKIAILITTLIVTMSHMLPVSAAESTPEATVEKFQALLIETMKIATSASVRQRFDLLRPGVEKAFHLNLMSQIATGRFWKTATQEERAKVSDAFLRMSVSTLATLFNGYNGENFESRSVRDGPSKTRLVITDLIKSDNSTVNITYVTRKFNDGWRIIDVVVDNGISELKVRQSEYNQILKSHGLPGLVSLLNSKADELMSRQ